MRVINLTNSPHDLVNASGEKVRLPARGMIERFEPHPHHAVVYRSIGYFRIEEDGTPIQSEAPVVEEPAALDAKSEAGAERGVAAEPEPEPEDSTGPGDGEGVGGDELPRGADEPMEALRSEYLSLSGKEADKRWAEKRIQVEIDKLKGLV